MANPNIANASSIYAKNKLYTTNYNSNTSLSSMRTETMLTCPSNKILKISSIVASVDHVNHPNGTSTHYPTHSYVIGVRVHSGGTTYVMDVYKREATSASAMGYAPDIDLFLTEGQSIGPYSSKNEETLSMWISTENSYYIQRLNNYSYVISYYEIS